MDDTDTNKDIIDKKGKEYIDNEVRQFVSELLKMITDRDCAQLHLDEKLRLESTRTATDPNQDTVGVAIKAQIASELAKIEIGIIFSDNPDFHGTSEEDYAYYIYLLRRNKTQEIVA